MTIIPESQPVIVKEEPTEDDPPINQPTEEPVSIPETQTSGLNEVTSIPETQISLVNEECSRKPKKKLSPSSRSPLLLVIKAKGSKQILKLL